MGRALRKSEGLLTEFGVAVKFSTSGGDRTVEIIGSKEMPKFYEPRYVRGKFHTTKGEEEEQNRIKERRKRYGERTFAEESRLTDLAFHRLILDQMKRGEKFYGNCDIVTAQKELHRISLTDEKGVQKPDEVLLEEIRLALYDDSPIADEPSFTEGERRKGDGDEL